MSDAAKLDDIVDMSFEQAMTALEQIVNRLEGGNAPLEDSIDLYSRGTLLKKHCESKLQDAQEKIEKLTLDDKGVPTGTAPLDVE